MAKCWVVQSSSDKKELIYLKHQTYGVFLEESSAKTFCENKTKELFIKNPKVFTIKSGVIILQPIWFIDFATNNKLNFSFYEWLRYYSKFDNLSNEQKEELFNLVKNYFREAYFYYIETKIFSIFD